MKNKRIIIGIFMLSASTLMVSCAGSKKSGCYYGEESVKELPIEKKQIRASYTIAE